MGSQDQVVPRQRAYCQASEARSLTPQQYRWLMEGLSVDQPKAHKPVSGLEII